MKKIFNHQGSILFLFVLSLHFSPFAIPSQSQRQTLQPPQSRQEPAPITFEKITDRLYQVKGGSGANCGVFLAEKELLIVDAKMSEESARQMIEGIKKISPLPLRFLALTHSDGDHVNGLPGFPPETKIIGHEETRRYMAEAFQEEKQKNYLPEITFSKELNVYLGSHLAQMLYFGPAHTSGDAVIYFPEEKVVFMGDLLFLGRDPLIHRHKNGNSFGLVKVLRSVLELNAEVFLSGHADRAGRGDIEAMIRALEDKQAKIKAFVAEGKSLEEIKKVFKVEDQPAQPGRPRRLSLPEVIYLELTEKK